MDNRKIIAARITTPSRLGQFGDMAKIHVKFENSDTEELLFSYFHDEITFSSSELVGRTVDEAEQLRHKKDVAYLQS
jgi:hypothetical protein